VFSGTKRLVLVRRLSDAAVTEVHGLRPHILMDAGELGSRHLSVNWLEVPPGVREELRSHEEAEQVYVVVAGTGTMSATGDTQNLGAGDLVLIPPATDHSVANDGEEPLALVSVQSPAVSADELYSRRLATQATGYDDYDDE
jgi:mannose-6-phosphate isomerase-like protein (cupin superfamily)